MSLNISIDGSGPTCMYQLRVSRGPHNFGLGLALVELVKALGELGQFLLISVIWPSLPSVLDKFNKCMP